MSDKSMPAQPVIPNDMPLEAENEMVLKSDFIKERMTSLNHDGFNFILPDTPQIIEEKKKKK